MKDTTYYNWGFCLLVLQENEYPWLISEQGSCIVVIIWWKKLQPQQWKHLSNVQKL